MTDQSTCASLTRRRMIAVCAGVAATVVPGIAPAQAQYLNWRGVALGAEAQVRLAHPDEQHARSALHQCLDEINRLEDMFSLYRPDSVLNRLNRRGELREAPIETIELVAAAQQISHETNGAFDITVQPVWQLYADHFSRSGADPAGPRAEDIRRILDLVDYRRIELSSQRIALTNQGMALTLNGIAQGFITDRISALLNRIGFPNVLVHLGETFGSGTKADGSLWTAGIADPNGSATPIRKVSLHNRALATSGGYGQAFAAGGPHHHIFNPRTGLSAGRYRSVSVAAPSAMVADALSTAFCNMAPAQIHQILSSRADTYATMVMQDDRIVEL